MSTALDDVLRDVQAAGMSIEVDPPDIIVTPGDHLTPELEERLRQHKAEILRLLQASQCFHCSGLRLCDCISCNAEIALQKGGLSIRPGPCAVCANRGLSTPCW